MDCKCYLDLILEWCSNHFQTRGGLFFEVYTSKRVFFSQRGEKTL